MNRGPEAAGQGPGNTEGQSPGNAAGHAASRRGAGEWASPVPPAGTPEVQVLIPSYGREDALAVTLAGLAAQDGPSFGVIISDQTEPGPTWEQPSAAAMGRVLQAQGRPVRLEHHLPRRGMAEQRDFLLGLAEAPLVLFLDNDVWLEPGMLARLAAALREAGCGFVGAAVQGLSYLDDVRPEEQRPFELWDGPVQPERIRRTDEAFGRWTLHNAANLAHIAARLGIPSGSPRLYRVAWVGGCVLFDRRALLDCGGFAFWKDLPAAHAGEDVVAQLRVMERYGGAGLIPSGAVHLEAPTTVTDRSTEASEVMLDP